MTMPIDRTFSASSPLPYATGESARIPRYVFLKSGAVIAIIVVLTCLFYGLAWVAEHKGSFMSSRVRNAILDAATDNFHFLIGSLSCGGLFACAVHWLQTRPGVARVRLLIVVATIHLSGLTIAVVEPGRASHQHRIGFVDYGM